MAARSSRPTEKAAVFDPGALGATTVLALLFTLAAEFKVEWATVPLGFFVLFVAPGYAGAALLFGRRPLPSLAANVALVVGLSVLVNVVLGTLFLAFAVAPLSPLIGLADSVVCIVGTAVQYGRPTAGGAPWSRQLASYFELPEFSSGQKAAAYALFVAILVTFGAIGYLAAAQPGKSPDLSLTVVGPDGTTATIPTHGLVNATYTVLVDVQNNKTAQSFVLTLNSTLVGANTTNRTVVPWVMPLALAPNVTTSDVLSLGAGGSTSITVEFSFGLGGDYAISVSLAASTSGTPVRSALIAIVIS